jgi:crossover junction endodeoxyribonuclease RuvC
MRILWIDPWTTTVWYAIIEKNSGVLRLIDYGVIKTTPKISLEQKLLEIGGDLLALIDKYQPQRAGIEKLFFNTNITTGIAVSHARWVILYELYKRGIEIHEYTPLQIKKAITGNGQAKKVQLQRAIQMIFGLSEIPKPDDAADAIGIAYITGLELQA